jgi:hypothetical protein
MSGGGGGGGPPSGDNFHDVLARIFELEGEDEWRARAKKRDEERAQKREEEARRLHEDAIRRAAENEEKEKQCREDWLRRNPATPVASPRIPTGCERGELWTPVGITLEQPAVRPCRPLVIQRLR